MAATLKRTLFIGLGGTGATALLHTKKRFLDTYGEVPPMIDFLVIDTDKNIGGKAIERDNVLELHQDKNPIVSFENAEYIHSKVIGATEIYDRNPDKFNWMPTENAHVLKNMTTGAGQVRSNGRFSVFHNHTDITTSISTKVARIKSIRTTNSGEYSLRGDAVEVNIIFSIAGGTGSGSFLDVAYLINDALSSDHGINIIGYAVLPDVFNAMMDGPSMANTKPNSYGALKELDYYMQNDVKTKNLATNFPENPIRVNSNPFEIVFTINNTNRNSETINSIDAIAEQIALALYTSASELSNNVESVFDNVKTVLSGGSLDIEGKRSWACGMGASELFYDGNTMGNIYANKVIVSMIDSLLNTGNDAQSIADNFVDRADVKIRENGGDENNDLIDSLLSNSPNINYSINDSQQVDMEINSHLTNIEKNAQNAIEENYKTKIQVVLRNLNNELESIINKKYGVGNSLAFLEGLEHLIKVFNGEMKEEYQDLLKKNESLTNATSAEIADLKKLESSTLSRTLNRSKIVDAKDSIEGVVNKRAIVVHELLRRKYAQTFFNELQIEVDNHKSNLENVINKLENVRAVADNQAIRLSNQASSKDKVFIIDLHKLELNQIKVDGEVFDIAEFVKTLNPHHNIYSFHQSTQETILKYFFDYAKELRESKAYVNKSIDEILENKSEEELEEIARQLMNKSQTLWNIDYHGYMGPKIHQQFVVGVSSLDLNFKKIFDKVVGPADKIEFVATRVKNKITCFRMEAAVPVFAVTGVSEYEKRYEEGNKRINPISYHVDQIVNRKMQEENFSIWPQRQADNSLPLWVLGLVYGFIKLNDSSNKYEIKSLEKGDPLDDYWIELNEYRDLAFNAFKQGQYLEELEAMIENKQVSDGQAQTTMLINDIKENYQEKYMQLNIDWSLLKTPPYKAVAGIVREELNFVTKELQ